MFQHEPNIPQLRRKSVRVETILISIFSKINCFPAPKKKNWETFGRVLLHGPYSGASCGGFPTKNCQRVGRDLRKEGNNVYHN